MISDFKINIVRSVPPPAYYFLQMNSYYIQVLGRFFALILCGVGFDLLMCFSIKEHCNKG